MGEFFIAKFKAEPRLPQNQAAFKPEKPLTGARGLGFIDSLRRAQSLRFTPIYRSWH
jgi:hypothetical protein